MAEKDQYYILIDGQAHKVNKEIYDVYNKGERKERYFSYDLKAERVKVDRTTQKLTVIPSREDSYERLTQMQKQFMCESESIEDIAVMQIMIERLKQILHSLPEEEKILIQELFFKETSEVQLAKQMGIARTTLQSRKYKILEKLKKLL